MVPSLHLAIACELDHLAGLLAEVEPDTSRDARQIANDLRCGVLSIGAMRVLRELVP